MYRDIGDDDDWGAKNKQNTAWIGYDDYNSDALSSSSSEEDSEGSDSYEHKKLSLAQACGLNTMNMFGTGPFITIPFVVGDMQPPGPHALFGYGMAAFACMNDSMVWSELGSMWPDSGGSYVYLRELFGRTTYGRLFAFLFVWQIMVSGPMECASGFIAVAQYLAFITQVDMPMVHAAIGASCCALTVWALYREIDEVGLITLILWAFTIGAIIFAVVAGYLNFNPEYIAIPPVAWEDGTKFFLGMGISARFAVYDFTGYYDVNFMGKEVKNPAKNIPIACITTCFVVAICFFLVDTAIIGSLEWRADRGGYTGAVLNGDASANYIMATFCETHIGYEFAVFFTFIVIITIFGSGFSFMMGLAQIPYTAAKDGYFYAFLAHEHPTMKGLQDYSLLFVGVVSLVFCFVDLEIVIEGMLTMQLLVQFMLQSFGLIWYRYTVPKEDQEVAPFSVPCFPLPNIIQLIIFGFIFCTTESIIFGGHVPLLEVAIAFLVAGVCAYMMWARLRNFWPFNKDFDIEFEEGLEEQMVVQDNFDQEIAVLKKRLADKDTEIRDWYRNHSSTDEGLRRKEAEVTEAISKLGRSEFRIINLARRIEESEDKVTELGARLSEQDRLYRNTLKDNEVLNTKVQAILQWWGNTDEPVFESQNIAVRSCVREWTKQEVANWWKEKLPVAAQKHLPIVEQYDLNGENLLNDVDEELLQACGVVKVLQTKIMKGIFELREFMRICDKGEQQEAEELVELEKRDLVNEESKTNLTNLLKQLGKKKELHVRDIVLTEHSTLQWGVSVSFNSGWQNWKVIQVQEGKQFAASRVSVGDRIIGVNGIMVNDGNADYFLTLLKRGDACKVTMECLLLAKEKEDDQLSTVEKKDPTRTPMKDKDSEVGGAFAPNKQENTSPLFARRGSLPI